MSADAPHPNGTRSARRPPRPWGRNPLRTRVHVLYEMSVCVLIAAAFTLPLLGYLAARAQFDAAAERRRTDLATNRPVVAVLDQNVYSTGGALGRGSAKARVTWTAADGTTRSGRAEVGSTGEKGARVTIWLDPAGAPAAAPAAQSRLAVDAVGLGAVVVLGGAGVLLSATAVARIVFMRSRMGAWARDWERTAPAWAGKGA